MEPNFKMIIITTITIMLIIITPNLPGPHTMERRGDSPSRYYLNKLCPGNPKNQKKWHFLLW